MEPLRIGLLLDSSVVPGWVADIIALLERSGKVRLVVVAVNTTPPAGSRAGFLFRLLRLADRIIFQHHPYLFRRVKLEISPDVQVYQITPVRIRGRSAFSESDLARIRECRPEVLLRFGFGILTGEVLTIAAHGVWSLHHGDMDHFRGGPPGFWEWYQRYPVTGVTLQRLTEELDGGICIARSQTRTQVDSFGRNQSGIFSKGIDLMADAVLRLAEGRQTLAEPDMPVPYSGPLYKDPGFLPAMAAFGKIFRRNFPAYVLRFLYLEQWVLFFRKSDPGSPALNFRRFQPLLPPHDRSWADPFVISTDNRHYVFVEELIYARGYGQITCLVLDDKGRIETSVPVLEKGYHLSYPNVFRVGENWYMIPESAQNKTVDLYVARTFPFDWEFCRTILSGIECFDATILQRDGYLWLFCTVRKRFGSSAHDDLHIYFSDDLLHGIWHPHSKNPVMSNPEQARPAGAFFALNGAIFRPSQVCVPRYGHGISINRVEMLDQQDYRESVVARTSPDWRPDLLTMHTLNFSDRLTVTDGQVRRFRWSRSKPFRFSILFVMDSLSTGGAEYSTLSLAGWMRNKMRWEVKVACLKDKQPSYDPAEFGLEGCIEIIRGESPVIQWFRLLRLVRRMDPAIIHSVLLYSNFFCRGLRLVRGGHIYVESLVNRTYDEARFRDPRVNALGLRVFRRLDRWTQRLGVDHFHAVTEDIRKHFMVHTGTPEEKISVVYRGRKLMPSPDPDGRKRIRKELGIGDQTIVFLSAGRHEYQKGQQILLKAFHRLQQSQAGDICLVVAGREGEETVGLNVFIGQHDLYGKVRLLGHRDDLRQIMGASDVFVLPSLFEGIGGVLIEAEAAGLPVICSALDGLREVVEEDRNALLVDPGDETALAAAMERMAMDADLRSSFGSAGREIFMNRFTETVSHEKMSAFYLDRRG